MRNIRKACMGDSRQSFVFSALWLGGMAVALVLMALVAAELFLSRPPVEGKVFHTWEEQEDRSVSSAQDPLAPSVSAQSAVVMDLSSGRVLYEKKKDERVYPASTTKIMTALLGIERGTLTEKITVGGEAIGVEGSSIYLKEGETMSLEDLLYGAMLRSGNDAATAIAMAIGEKVEDETKSASSTERFVALMNQKATKLGAKNTHFVNPTGLHDENHYTTAFDMALIGRAAMSNPEFCAIAQAKSWTAQREEGRDPYFYNKNKVVHQYQGGNGVKIGYTKATGRTLVASSEREGKKLICVVMNAPDWFHDAYRLMDYAYEAFETKEIAAAGQKIKKVAVEGGVRDSVWVGVQKEVSCLIRPTEQNNVGIACVVTKPVKAPVRRGEAAGTLHVYVSGQYVCSTPLFFFEDVDGGKS